MARPAEAAVSADFKEGAKNCHRRCAREWVRYTADGRFVYVSHGLPADTAPSVLTGFAIGPDGLPRRQVAEATIGISGSMVEVTPDGRFVYVTCQGTDEVFGFGINAGGSLTQVAQMPAGDHAEDAEISPDGRLLYVAGPAVEGTGSVSGFTIGADGSLTPVGRPVPMPTPAGVAFAPDGWHLYVSDWDDGTVTVFAIGTAGELTAVQTLSSGGSRPGAGSVAVLPDRAPVAAP